MVFVNATKYACEACIKGHRSSSCHHNDRPLFEIKKKGRPVSQCEKCRHARIALKIHGKCNCDPKKEASTSAGAGTANVAKKQGRRFVPCPPALPNGVKDALKASGSSSSSSDAPKQSVTALLNPCHCKDVYNCRCRTGPGSSTALASRPSKPVDPAIFNDGLSALALVASCCSPAVPSSSSTNSNLNLTVQSSSLRNAVALPPLLSHLFKDTESRRSVGPTKRKRSPGPQREQLNVGRSDDKIFRPLAPAPPMGGSIWDNPQPSHEQTAAPPFILPNAAPAIAVSSDEKYALRPDNSSCCCGTRCECTGCSVHGPSNSDTQDSWVDDSTDVTPSTEHDPQHEHAIECSEDCPTCVNHDGGIELPPSSSTPGVPSSSHTPAPSYLATFLARAETIPALPVRHHHSSFDSVPLHSPRLFKRPRRSGESVVELLTDSERPHASASARFSNCCGGRCGCADDTCGCGSKCDGSCLGTESNGDWDASDFENKGRSVSGRTSRLSPSTSYARQNHDSSSSLLPVSGVRASKANSRGCCQPLEDG